MFVESLLIFFVTYRAITIRSSILMLLLSYCLAQSSTSCLCLVFNILCDDPYAKLLQALILMRRSVHAAVALTE